MSRKVKCHGCKEYVDRTVALRVGLSSYCGWDCVNTTRKVSQRGLHSSRPKYKNNTLPESIRQTVIDRDKNCRICHGSARLNVHHILYRSEAGPDSEENLILLCSMHHTVIHSDKVRFQPQLLECMDELYRTGYFPVKDWSKSSRQQSASIRRITLSEVPSGVEPRRYKTQNGYYVLRWAVGSGEYVEMLEHRYVAKAGDGQIVHHIDGNRANNHPDNLLVMSHADHGKEHRAFDRDHACRLYEADGWSTVSIGEYFDVDPSVVYRALVKQGVALRKSGSWARLHLDDEYIVASYRQGKSPEVIAAELGVSTMPIWDRLKEYNVPIRPPGRRKASQDDT